MPLWRSLPAMLGKVPRLVSSPQKPCNRRGWRQHATKRRHTNKPNTHRLALKVAEGDVYAQQIHHTVCYAKRQSRIINEKARTPSPDRVRARVKLPRFLLTRSPNSSHESKIKRSLRDKSNDQALSSLFGQLRLRVKGRFSSNSRCWRLPCLCSIYLC